MTPDSITTFLTGYLHSLAEESRTDKHGRRFGFDQVILQLALAEQWLPLRLAFHRGGRKTAPKPKKEAEHGVDLKVLSPDGTILRIFVLKDEPLTYKNWEDERFHSDLRRASEQDLSTPELRQVKEVQVVLAYNKDEEEEGLEEYSRFIASRGKRVGRAKLRFNRWNLDELVRRVREQLLESPGLLPEQFFHAFSYLCWQVADFSHGSPQWREVLIPDWKEFIDDVLQPPLTERAIRLISVALLVLRSHGKPEPAFETGWIELIEWAVLGIWRSSRTKLKNKKIATAALEVWLQLYLPTLEAYYQAHGKLLSTEDSLAADGYRRFAEAIGSYFAYWHMARLGILGMIWVEIYAMSPDQVRPAIQQSFQRTLDTLIGLVNANPASRRPLLDIHHIQLFLLWRMLRFAQRSGEALAIFEDIHQRLLYRRLGQGGQRLIDQSNSWPNLLEFIATREEASEAYGRSSYLLQMILEISIRDFGTDGGVFARSIYRHLIQGRGDDGASFEFPERVELVSWAPASDWGEKVLAQYVGNEGVSLTINSYYDRDSFDLSDLPDRISTFVSQSRSEYPLRQPEGVPGSICILACLLHGSPIPPEFWRTGLYDDKPPSADAA